MASLSDLIDAKRDIRQILSYIVAEVRIVRVLNHFYRSHLVEVVLICCYRWDLVMEYPQIANDKAWSLPFVRPNIFKQYLPVGIKVY